MNEALVWIKQSRSNIESCICVLNIIFPGWNVEKVTWLIIQYNHDLVVYRAEFYLTNALYCKNCRLTCVIRRFSPGLLPSDDKSELRLNPDHSNQYPLKWFYPMNRFITGRIYDISAGYIWQTKYHCLWIGYSATRDNVSQSMVVIWLIDLLLDFSLKMILIMCSCFGHGEKHFAWPW